MILRRGIRQPVLGIKKRDYWQWLEQLPQHDTCGRLTQLCLALEKASNCKKVLTAQGKGRHFLRQALNKKLLAVAIQHLMHTSKLLEWYEPALSVLGNEDLTEPFLSLLLVVSDMNFCLDVENSSFLDDSWLLPVADTYETVPCRELGMVLKYLNGRIFITDIIPGSQAEVDEFVMTGDIIDEINGISLRKSPNGQAGFVLQKFKGKPLNFRIIRWKWRDGKIYKPMLPLLKLLQEEVPDLRLNFEKPTEECEAKCLEDGRLLYMLKYMGKVNVGMYGGKEVLDQGIPTVLDKRLPPRDVSFDVKETEVICTDKSSSKVLFHHQYPEVSCVGRCLGNNGKVFGFCVADFPEAPGRSTFDCLVLECNSEQECDEIVRRIAAGFKHTEWFV
ncbi:uncharacterized protein LOC122812915 isoform X2 [Protopterus annectens]|nr:uncharacterized protein LOC122812915 isoform X2 [Protopterus annectens]